jgi:hypothetical protein
MSAWVVFPRIRIEAWMTGLRCRIDSNLLGARIAAMRESNAPMIRNWGNVPQVMASTDRQ